MSPFGRLQPLRERPLPNQDGRRALLPGYRAHPLDLTDPRAAEPLAPIEDFGLAGVSYYAIARNPPYYAAIPGAPTKVYVRRGVGEALAFVNARLAAADLELFLFDGWRPNVVQAYFHDVWMPERVRAGAPHLTEAQVLQEVERYWSAPTTDPAAPAPHATGGAVDLTLRWRGGEALWMGSLFDDVTEIAHADCFETPQPGEAYSHAEARANRRLLYWTMAEAGFAPNPNEWWHFGYGELMWARLIGAPAGFYGAVTRAPDEGGGASAMAS